MREHDTMKRPGAHSGALHSSEGGLPLWSDHHLFGVGR